MLHIFKPHCCMLNFTQLYLPNREMVRLPLYGQSVLPMCNSPLFPISMCFVRSSMGRLVSAITSFPTGRRREREGEGESDEVSWQVFHAPVPSDTSCLPTIYGPGLRLSSHTLIHSHTNTHGM